MLSFGCLRMERGDDIAIFFVLSFGHTFKPKASLLFGSSGYPGERAQSGP